MKQRVSKKASLTKIPSDRKLGGDARKHTPKKKQKEKKKKKKKKKKNTAQKKKKQKKKKKNLYSVPKPISSGP